jgi:hypothetical protein
MANTGYKRIPTVKQFFTTGPQSGSVVSASYDRDLTVTPFSASLDNVTFYNRSFDPETCEIGFEDCLVPLLTSLNTGSLRGRFEITYVTQSGFNPPLDITASVANNESFANSEIFSASIGNTIPITSSFVSGTVYFKAFTSCSGPTPSPDSSPLSFTFNPLSPPRGNANIVFTNNYSTTMKVEIRSERGNQNYNIAPRASVTYNYVETANPGSWSTTGKADPLNITIKGGAKNTYGNYIQRRTNDENRVIFTSGGGFGGTDKTENSSTFVPDKGLTFKIQQLELPPVGTTSTTTFTLLANTPPPAVAPPTAVPELVFGTSPFSTQAEICNFTRNFRERTYYLFNNYLYNTQADALADRKATYPNEDNYILINQTRFLKVNKQGYTFGLGFGSGDCPTNSYRLSTSSTPTAIEACKRTSWFSSSRYYTFKNNTLIDSFGYRRSGYFWQYNGAGRKPSKIFLISGGKFIATQDCSTDVFRNQPLLPLYGGFKDFGPEGWESISPSSKRYAKVTPDYRYRTYYIDSSTGQYFRYGSFNFYYLSGWAYNKPAQQFLYFQNGIITHTFRT